MVCITGGTGVIGSNLVARLRARGERIRMLVLPGEKVYENDEHVEVWHGDITDRESIRGLCRGVDTVYHLAAVIVSPYRSIYERVNVQGTAHVCDEARTHGVRHMIYVSSASVVYPCTTAYARSKKRSETIVRHAGMQWTIVRPTLVYDEYKGGEFGMFLSFLRRFPVVPFIGPGTARKRPVYAPDLADGLARLCRHDDAAGRVFNFSGPEVVSIEDFARLCLILSGMPRTRIVHLPVWLCLSMAALAHMLMKEPPLTWQVIAGMTQDADIDPGETQRILGYNPRGVHEMLPHCFSRQNVFYSNIATDSHIATQ